MEMKGWGNTKMTRNTTLVMEWQNAEVLEGKLEHSLERL